MSSTKQKDVIQEIKEIIRDLGEGHKKAQIEMQEIRKNQDKAHQKAQVEMKEIRETQRKTEMAQQEVAEAQKKTEIAQQKTEMALQELSKSLNKVDGDFNNKWGRFMEDLVKGDLINLLNERKMEVIRVLPRVPYYRSDKTQEGEVDLIALNGKELVAVEIKTTLKVQDVDKFIKKILNPFKKRFPEYAKKTIYGAVAYLDEEDASEYAESKGLFIIKAPGGEAKVSTITNAKDFKPKEYGEE